MPPYALAGIRLHPDSQVQDIVIDGAASFPCAWIGAISVSCSRHKKVMRLMQQNGLNRAAGHGNDRQQPRSADFSEPCQEYRADNWNQLWVADITYIAIDADCRHPIRRADRLGADRPEYETTG